jgi:hypothetical protein
MSIDPETLRQIEELAADTRPLLILDVDDVLLDFIKPFPTYLERAGYRLDLKSFRLTGNIVEIETGIAIEQPRVTELLDGFFGAQHEWQTLVEGAADCLGVISRDAEIVLLTAMPHRHRDARRRHLDGLGLTFPLLTTEMKKGPAVKRLRGDTPRPVAFVDDMLHNLTSAREHVADAHLFHLVADPRLRDLQPPAGDDVHSVDGWPDATGKIAAALGL